jgi:hypothetical protein
MLLIIDKRYGNFPVYALCRTFKIVFVALNHGNGEIETVSPDKVITYTGKEVIVN